MLRRRSMKFGLLAVGLVAPIAATACTADGVALHIECNIAPDVSDEGCIWDPSSDACVFNGQLNVRAATSYVAGFRVASGLKPRASTSPPRAEPNGIQLSEAEIELRTPGGAPLDPEGLDNPYTLVAAGYVPPEGTGLMQIELLPPAYVSFLRELELDSDNPLGQVVASVTIRGVTDGQTKVETAPFYWPIRLVDTSPIVERGQCRVFETVCLSTQGIDGFASACLCDTASGGNCDLGE